MSDEIELIESPQTEAAKKIAILVYALQAGTFIIPILFVASVVVNYVKKGDISGTWIESHFRWQIRTFWFGLLWGFFGIITLIMGVGYFILIGVAIWVIYRIAKGWLALNDNKPMYLED
ncbi:hypothetical protein MMIC_P2226 [Mariprofundus micogutta]|uniref:Transmembrane protein n=1 Tax=Mariprofundus micogutta TaxID=1921010 RepID=A0A1L8CQT6_9PROT|nr:hypothetical protein [Mariprofundus micogutta]GAV21244.1 hypothetical protein MMIC_P2226 [Mariprofundus micogutta]